MRVVESREECSSEERRGEDKIRVEERRGEER
jgi:hypothetical protein